MGATEMVLIIGYGNTLRGDDGVGYQVAAAVAEWPLPWVRSQAVHQLLPELAAAISTASTVMFVDAVVTRQPAVAAITVKPVVVQREAQFRTHSITPAVLLGLAQRLYAGTPTAYLLTIPAINFELGAAVSPITAQGQTLALRYLRWFVHHTLSTPCMNSVC